MKAIAFTKPGLPDVLQIAEVAKPVPKEDEVLVKVRAVAVNPLDLARVYDKALARFIGWLLKQKKQLPGVDIAGQVEAVGSGVKQFQPGDAVFGLVGGGGLAEYVCAREKNLVTKPANLSFEAAAAVPVVAFTDLQGLRDAGHIQAGQKVLIYGASGGVGTFAVQIAKSFGAEVTAVCSTRNLDMVRSIGADHVVDYTREDFTKSGQRYDLILAVSGYRPISDYRKALKPGGLCVVVGGTLAQIFQVALLGSLVSKFGNKKIGFMGIAKPNLPDLVYIRELLENGKIRPIIDRCYPLSETAQALRHLEAGHAAGKVVITVA